MGEEITRILNANNPHAPQNISRYNHKEHAFKTVANMEHVSFHFEYDGYLVYNIQEDSEVVTSGEEETELKAEETPVEEKQEVQPVKNEAEEVDVKKVPLRNQFNYSERASQTVNNPNRERSTNTEPPPQRSFSDTVNQWSIYDMYVEDALQKEKISKEKSKVYND